MLIYLAVFAISCLFIKMGENKKNRVILFIGLILPCFLAGLRAENIGTDVVGYVNPLCEFAQETNSIYEYFQAAWWTSYRFRAVKEIEFFYNILVILCVRFANSKQFLLFVTQVLTVFPLWCGIKKIIPRGSAWLGMLTYYLMFYNVSLNAMRQWIAMAIVILGFSYLIIDKNNAKYFICVISAFFFHKSAIIGICFWLMYMFINFFGFKHSIRLGQIKLNGKCVQILMCICIILIIYLYPTIILFVLKIVGLDEYSNYFDIEPTFLITQLVIRMPIIVVLWMGRKNIKNNIYRMLVLFAALDVVFANYVATASHLLRVSYWFSGYSVITYPYVINIFCIKRRKIMTIGIIFFLVCYWIYFFVVKGDHETFPYQFYWSIQ